MKWLFNTGSHYHGTELARGNTKAISLACISRTFTPGGMQPLSLSSGTTGPPARTGRPIFPRIRRPPTGCPPLVMMGTSHSPGTICLVILGIERELVPNVAIEGNYIYKRFTNQHWVEWPVSGATGSAGMHGQQYQAVDSNGQDILSPRVFRVGFRVRF